MATSLVNGLGGSAGFGENFLDRNDDDSTGLIDLHSVFPDGLNLFGNVYTGLYLNNNGSVTFNYSVSTFTPTIISGETDNPIIAPYWGDVDTRAGVVAASPGGTSTGSDLLWYDLDSANHTFTATWDDVGYFSEHTDKLNAFQLQLVGVPDSDGVYSGDFDIFFRYETLNWTTGDASSGTDGLGGIVARAGYSSGDGVDYFELPQSGNQGAMLALTSASNIGVPGTYEFNVRNGTATASISTSDASVTEGNGGTDQYVAIPVQLAAPSSSIVTVAYATADGTATAGSDYIAQRGVLTFLPGMTQQSVFVEIVGDTVVEPDETFTLNLSDATGAPITTPTSTVTIVNDDGLSIADVSQAEGSGGGTTPFVFTVSLLSAETSPVTVDYAVTPGTAQPGDYDGTLSGALTFAAGQTQQQITVDVAADSNVEEDENFFVTLSNANGAGIARATATGTILNDDGFVVDDGAVIEGTGGTNDVQVSIRLLSALDVESTVRYTTVAGTATANSDYTPVAGTLTFAPGQTLATVSVPIITDSAVESNENFSVVLSDPVNSAIVRGAGTITIDDDDGFNVNDVTADEGSGGGTTTMTFTVTLGSALDAESTVRYTTVAHTATANSDYTPVAGTLTFAPGQTVQTVDVPIMADDTPEPDETFQLVLSDPSANAGIERGVGEGLIVNDDGLSVGDASTPEGDSGTSTVVVPVTLSGPMDGAVTVDWATADGTATAGSDYVAASGQLTFAPGETEQDITLTINGDTVWEADESFRVVLSNPVGSAIVDGTGSVTIENDDTQPLPSLSVISTEQTEGTGPGDSTMHFVVGLSRAADSDVTVDYATSNGTAIAGSDYVATSGTLTIAAGSPYGVIAVPVVRDSVVEPNETFTVTLSNPTDNATIGAGVATGTIINDDTSISITSGGPVGLLEGDSGATPYPFTLTRIGDASQVQTVDYTVAPAGAAQANGADFVGGVLPSGQVTFAAGQTTLALAIEVAGDTVVEPNEGFTVTLSNPSGGATIGTGSANGAILNDDAQLAIAATDANKLEGDSGSTPFTFTVTRTGYLSRIATASWQVIGAVPNSVDETDFVGGAPMGELTFAAGQSTGTITVNVAGDTALEPDEHFQVVLGSATGATITTGAATGTILNDDAQLAIAASDASKAEGNSGSTPFTFTVTRTGYLDRVATANWQVIGGSPNSANPADFAGGVPSGVLTFAVGQSTGTITVGVAGDTAVEPDEHFQVVLGSATGAAVTTAAATGTILNDDAQLAIAATDASKAEGNSGSTPFTFTVTRTGYLDRVATVNWQVIGGSPNSANSADFAGGVPSGVLTFAAGQSTGTITVGVAGDTAVEPDEHFQVVLGTALGATVTTASATGTILNDDSLVPSLAIAASDADKAEGNSGSTPFTFTVTRTGNLAGVSTVNWQVIGGSPNSANPADFAGGVPSGVLTFAAGQSTGTITVGVAGDTAVEPDEHFQVVLGTALGATVTTASATGTILNDDSLVPSLAIAASDADKAEGNSGSTPFTFTVTRTGNLAGVSTVNWQVIGGSPNSANPADFAGGVPSGVLTFAAGQGTGTITVGVAGDTAVEPDEHFQVVLGTALGATVTTASATGTILNDDSLVPSLAIAASDADKAEGNSGSTPFTFTVTRTGNLAGVSTVNWQVIGGSPNSANPADFAGGVPSGVLTFAAGQSTGTITVGVAGDTAVEPDEHFQVVLGTALGATVTTASATGTILNDDSGAGADIGVALTPLASADFTGDGVADRLSQGSGGALFMLDGASGVMAEVSQSAQGLSFVAAADFDGDGRSDLLLQGAGGQLFDWTMAGATVLHADLVTQLAAGQSVVGTQDHTGDGRADILLHDGAGAGGWTLLAMDGPTITATTHSTTLPDAWQA